MSTITLPQARIAIAWAETGGVKVPCSIDVEWMKALTALVDRVGGVSGPSIQDLMQESSHDVGYGEALAAHDDVGQLPPTFALIDESAQLLAQPGALDELRGSAALLARLNVYTAAQAVKPVALVDGATIATDASLSNTFTVTLGGNRTLSNPTGMVDGGIYNWRIKQDGTGTRTLAYGTKFKWAGGSAPVLTTAANATDFISAQYFADTDTLLGNVLKGFA